MIEVEHTAHTAAPRSEVWKKLAALDDWHEWGPWTRTTSAEGVRTMVSERKRMNGKPYVMRERLTRLQPEDLLEYDLLSGLPVRNYHATVTLADSDGGGTDIRWAARFDPPWPVFNGLWRGGMQKVLRDVSEDLAASMA